MYEWVHQGTKTCGAKWTQEWTHSGVRWPGLHLILSSALTDINDLRTGHLFSQPYFLLCDMRRLDFTRKISLGILPAPTLEPKDFNKEWKAFLPFGEISVKTGRKVKNLLKSHPSRPSPSDHTFLPGDKGPDSTSAADFEDISETFLTLWTLSSWASLVA